MLVKNVKNLDSLAQCRNLDEKQGVMKPLVDIISLIPELSFEDLFLLREKISVETLKQRQEIRESLVKKVDCCPHCGGAKFIKWGHYKGENRYFCSGCSRTFTATTGTPLHWLKKPDAFLDYATVMFSDGFNSVQTQAERVGISPTTAFEWRHRALISLGREAPVFKGVTEMDDVWFRYSQKGRKGLKYSRKRGRSSHQGDNNFVSKLLVTKQRDAELDISFVKIGRLSAQDISAKLGGKFEKTATIISDKHPSIQKFAIDEGIEYQSFKASEHSKNQTIHVQTVNQIAGSLHTGLNRVLRGVSSKYLQNYATWFSITEKYKSSKEKVKNIIIDCISNIKAWDMNTNIEKLYEQFLQKHSVRTYRCPTQKMRKSQNWNFENAKSGAFL